LAQVFPNPFFGLAPSYIGTITRAGLLRPYPQFGSLTAIVPDGYTWYHSMQLRVERRMRKGLSIQGSYVWSKFMEAQEYLNPGDTRPYESLADTDRPHRITVSGIWEIPVGRGRHFNSQMPKQLQFLVHQPYQWRVRHSD